MSAGDGPSALPQDSAAKAGRLHNHLLNASRDTANGVYTLPGLMAGMLEGDGWREMIRPKDGKVFTHSTIAEWVLGEPWGGLNFKSWDMLYAILKRSDEGRRVFDKLVERGAPADGFAEDVRQAKAAGKSLRQIARERGVHHSTVVRSGAGRTANHNRIRLGHDPHKTASTIIAARGPDYARALMAALAEQVAK